MNSFDESLATSRLIELVNKLYQLLQTNAPSRNILIKANRLLIANHYDPVITITELYSTIEDMEIFISESPSTITL